MPTSSVKSLKMKGRENKRHARSFCLCWNKRAPNAFKQHTRCSCGEENNLQEWRWEAPEDPSPSWIVMSETSRRVTFHPFYSSGTAAVRGDTALQLNYQYYFEIKMLTDTYGTDIMIGVGTDKVNVRGNQFKFTSLLGQDTESYGLSYTGAVRHNATSSAEGGGMGFCRGTVIGVRLDMWRGTLEFFLNRKPQGISFYNLRRHEALYPMACSTAAQSSMRLTYASSWQASLLVDAAKTLASSMRKEERLRVPPGMWNIMKSQFWLMLPTEGSIDEEVEKKRQELASASSNSGVTIPGYYNDGTCDVELDDIYLGL